MKLIYKKNGYIYINTSISYPSNINENFFIINNFQNNTSIDQIKKKYYQTIGFTYQ